MWSLWWHGGQAYGGTCFRMTDFKDFSTNKLTTKKSHSQPSRSGWVVSTNAHRHVYMYVDQKGLAAMLTSVQSAGVTPEVNLRNSLCAGEEACKRGNPPWLWNPGQTSPEVQNRGISGPTKRTYVLQKLKKKISFSILNFVASSPGKVCTCFCPMAKHEKNKEIWTRGTRNKCHHYFSKKKIQRWIVFLWNKKHKLLQTLALDAIDTESCSNTGQWWRWWHDSRTVVNFHPERHGSALWSTGIREDKADICSNSEINPLLLGVH